MNEEKAKETRKALMECNMPTNDFSNVQTVATMRIYVVDLETSWCSGDIDRVHHKSATCICRQATEIQDDNDVEYENPRALVRTSYLY
jgi:hypothetical protein